MISILSNIYKYTQDFKPTIMTFFHNQTTAGYLKISADDPYTIKIDEIEKLGPRNQKYKAPQFQTDH